MKSACFQWEDFKEEADAWVGSVVQEAVRTVDEGVAVGNRNGFERRREGGEMGTA